MKRFLGEGGKKKAYLAHDNVLDRNVAFALIKTEGLDDTAKTRITREAQPMGKLGDHPHLMPIHDLGREGDQPYMTLPLMRSGDVEGLIKKAPSHQLPIEKTLEIGIAVAKGLAFAHGKGIMHRDIKPGNVWMTAEGVAKIGDFGLAIASDTALRLTTAGMMVGTPCRTHRDVEPDRTLVTSSWMIVSCAESQSLRGHAFLCEQWSSCGAWPIPPRGSSGSSRTSPSRQCLMP